MKNNSIITNILQEHFLKNVTPAQKVSHTFLSESNNPQQFTQLINFLSVQATSSDIALANKMLPAMMHHRLYRPRQETLARSLNIDRKTVHRFVKKANHLLFEVIPVYRGNKRKANIYRPYSWIKDARCIAQLSRYVRALLMFPAMLLFSRLPEQAPLAAFNKMSQRVITKGLKYIINSCNDNFLANKKELFVNKNKPDYVTTWSKTETKKESTVKKLFPLYQKPAERVKETYQERMQIAKALLNDEKYQSARDFLAFLDQETVKKLFVNHIARKDE